MDTLFWKNLSPEIKIESSTRQFFKQYFYRLEVYAPGCKSIRDEDIAESISRRALWARSYNQPGSWWNHQLVKYLAEADVGFLHSLGTIKYEYPDVKIRTEEPKFSIYATDETMIKSVAQSIDPDHRNQIISICGPENNSYCDILKNNAVLVKKPPKFRYRVFFKEKQFDFNIRNQIYSYLEQLGDIVRMTDHTKDSLMKPHNWIWGCYFYTNDRGVADMVRLINPDIIREVSELVCLDNK